MTRSKPTVIRPKLRQLCMSFPGRRSGSATVSAWFVPVSGHVRNHHHDDRLAFWCAAPDGAQHVLVSAAPERFYVPPYVGHRGWLGVWLDVPVDWDEIAFLVADAYRAVAPKRLAALLDAQAAG
jgi:hypothetical protein